MNKKAPAYVLTFMAAICLVFGIAVSAVNQLTKNMLERNAVLHRNKVLCAAFLLDVPGSKASDFEKAVADGLRTESVTTADGQREVYRCVVPGREAVGFSVSGVGFWDRIEGILVLTPDLKRVVNIKFLEEHETPGLGARINEEWFTDQFKGIEPDWDGPPKRRIIIGASHDANAHNRVDAITGATQTSMALMQFLNAELDKIRSLDLSAIIMNAARAQEVPNG